MNNVLKLIFNIKILYFAQLIGKQFKAKTQKTQKLWAHLTKRKFLFLLTSPL